jgi:hypothetical protein
MAQDQGKMQGFEADKTLECMQQSLPARKDNCVIVLATDRQRTLDDVQSWAQSKQIRCQFMHSASAHSDDAHHFGLAATNKIKQGVESVEHGPWGDSMLVFADMHLMSFATSFVGSKGYSTYASSLSILFGSIIAGKTGLVKTQRFAPACLPPSFNGEIVNGTHLYAEGRSPQVDLNYEQPSPSSSTSSAPNRESAVADAADATAHTAAETMETTETTVSAGKASSQDVTGGRTLAKAYSKKKSTPVFKFIPQHKSLYDEYTVEHPVLHCETESVDRCSFDEQEKKQEGHGEKMRIRRRRLSLSGLGLRFLPASE